MTRLALVVAVGACSDPASAPSAATPDRCSELVVVARRAVQAELAGDPDYVSKAGPYEKAVLEIGRSCRTDRWPTSAIDCVITATPTRESLETCARMLPVALQDNLEYRIRHAVIGL